MTKWRVSKDGAMEEIPEEVKEPSEGDTYYTTTIIEEEKEAPPWNEVDWPFEQMFGDQILVQVSGFKYNGRIFIPPKQRNSPTKGVVVMVGPLVDDVKPGELILYSQFAGYLLTFDGIPKCRVMARSELLGRLKPEAPALLSEGS